MQNLTPMHKSPPGTSPWGNVLEKIEIQEDSIRSKLFACIPVIGIIPGINKERSLKKKINETQFSARIVKLISVKNHYKISSVINVSLSLSVALVIASLALAIFGPAIGMGVALASLFIGVSCIAFQAYGIYKNKQLMNEVRTSGQPPLGIHVR